MVVPLNGPAAAPNLGNGVNYRGSFLIKQTNGINQLLI